MSDQNRLNRHKHAIPCPIPGVLFFPLEIHTDERGSLTEFWRLDDIDGISPPVMAYMSFTLAGASRGPHEHAYQTDRFIFAHNSIGLFLWDNRAEKPSPRLDYIFGEFNPMLVTVPPGVVHAYQNIDTKGREALVVNLPDKLYGGIGGLEEVDEIRHEGQPNSPFKISDASKFGLGNGKPGGKVQQGDSADGQCPA